MTKKLLTLPVLKNKKEDKSETVEVDAGIFAQKINPATLAQVLRVYTHNSHQQTKKVKTRSGINLTKTKLYRQKGTGRARHGAKSAPIFVGGGVAHGPKGRLTRLKLPKKLKNKALKAILTQKRLNHKLFVFIPHEFKKPQTKKIAELLKLNNLDKQKINLSLDKKDYSEKKNFILSARNLNNINPILSTNLNPHHLFNSKILILTKNSLESITKRLIVK